MLYPASRHGVARLEFFDCKEGASAADRVGTKRLDKTIVRLADCVSVAPAPDSSPKDGFSAFRLETSERAYLFAAELQEATEWMGKLCETAFPVSCRWGKLGKMCQAGLGPWAAGRRHAARKLLGDLAPSAALLLVHCA